AIGLLQPDLAFQKGLGILIDIKHDGGLVPLKRKTLTRGKRSRAFTRVSTGYLKIHRRFGKGSEKIPVSHRCPHKRGKQPKKEHPHVTPAQNIRARFAS